MHVLSKFGVVGHPSLRNCFVIPLLKFVLDLPARAAAPREKYIRDWSRLSLK